MVLTPSPRSTPRPGGAAQGNYIEISGRGFKEVSCQNEDSQLDVVFQPLECRPLFPSWLRTGSEDAQTIQKRSDSEEKILLDYLLNDAGTPSSRYPKRTDALQEDTHFQALVWDEKTAEAVRPLPYETCLSKRFQLLRASGHLMDQDLRCTSRHKVEEHFQNSLRETKKEPMEFARFPIRRDRAKERAQSLDSDSLSMKPHRTISRTTLDSSHSMSLSFDTVSSCAQDSNSDTGSESSLKKRLLSGISSPRMSSSWKRTRSCDPAAHSTTLQPFAREACLTKQRIDEHAQETCVSSRKGPSNHVRRPQIPRVHKGNPSQTASVQESKSGQDVQTVATPSVEEHHAITKPNLLLMGEERMEKRSQTAFCEWKPRPDTAQRRTRSPFAQQATPRVQYVRELRCVSPVQTQRTLDRLLCSEKKDEDKMHPPNIPALAFDSQLQDRVAMLHSMRNMPGFRNSWTLSSSSVKASAN